MMRLRLIQDGLFFVALTAVLVGCYSEPDFSDTPTIQYIATSKETIEATPGIGNDKRDLVMIAIKFQDKSGDLGEDISTTDSVRRRVVFGSETWGNYKVQTFKYQNGKYTLQPPSEDQKIWFPRLFKPNQKGALEGTLYFQESFIYSRSSIRYPVKFQVQIRDRALNVSNVIETDSVVVPLPN